MKRVLLVLMLLFVSKGFSLPAFPGAEGFGSETIGGRGGKILHVTNLNDNGVGSLREAINTSGPRTIIFDVCGTIELATPLDVNEPFLTIAGQTAPGGGICLKNSVTNPGSSIRINTHDVIVRYIRVRPGQGINGSQVDAIGICSAQSFNIVIDHCSISWAIDENFQIWSWVSDGDRCEDITFQWNIVSEPLNRSIHEKGGAHGMGVLIAGSNTQDISMHHNLMAHNYRRNPFVKTSGLVDVVNNVFYNWGDFTSGEIDDAYSQQQINFRGNYYIKGPESSAPAVRVHDLGIDDQGGSNTNTIMEIFFENIWLKEMNGTLSPVVPVVYNNYNSLAATGIEVAWPDNNQINTIHHISSPVLYESDMSKLDNLLFDFSGANLPKRDISDTKMVNNIIAQTGQVIDCVEPTDFLMHSGTITSMTVNASNDKADIIINSTEVNSSTNEDFWHYKILIDSRMFLIEAYYPSTNTVKIEGANLNTLNTSGGYELYCNCAKNAGGWPNLMDGFTDANSNFIPDNQENLDLDNDGMADAWEAKYKVSSPNADNDNDGYTNIEEFLNKTIPNSVLIPGSGSIRPLLVSPTEITEAEYGDVMRKVPLCFNADEKPMVNVTYYDAILYCNERSKREKLDTVYTYDIIPPTSPNDPNDPNASPLIDEEGCFNLVNLKSNHSKNGYRLPTREEWKYSYLGGTKSSDNSGYYWPNGSDATKYAHYGKTESQPVGTLLPNGYGLYDMAGNVSEWVEKDETSFIKMNGSFASGLENLQWYDDAYNKSHEYTGNGFNGFRVVRRAPDITPAINLLLD